jgi:pheromone shutdown protein TraB
VRPDLRFDRYLVAACSLMLAVMLVVGASGYAGIQGLSSSSTAIAKLATLEQQSHEADRGRIFTPAAIALAMIAVFLVAIDARAASPRRYPIE